MPDVPSWQHIFNYRLQRQNYRLGHDASGYDAGYDCTYSGYRRPKSWSNAVANGSGSDYGGTTSCFDAVADGCSLWSKSISDTDVGLPGSWSRI